MLKKIIVFFLIIIACYAVDATKINIYNLTGNPDLIIYFQNGGDAKNNTGLKNFPVNQPKYIQPWSSKPWSGEQQTPLALDQPFTCSYDTIESQVIRYLMGNKNDPSFVLDNYIKGIAPGTGAPWWIGGFFEFTGLKNQQNYYDITNVDQMGLFAGYSDGITTWGYGKTPIEMIEAVEAIVPEVKQNNPTPVNPESKSNPPGRLPAALIDLSITYKDAVTKENVTKTFQKLQGPTGLYAYYYIKLPKEYLDKVTGAGVNADVLGDSTITNANPPPHCGPQMPAFKFEGRFFDGNYKAPKGVTLPENLKPEDVVLALTCIKPPIQPEKINGRIVKPKPVTVFYTKAALNPKTILSGDSSNGVFIHNAYNVGIGNGAVKYYVEWVTTNDVSYKDTGKGVGLNWVTPVGDPVYSTSCFQAMINSLARDVIIGFNEGTIPMTPGSTFNSQDHKTVYGKQYINQWNSIIVSNSDSYGMAYSDGAGKSKVLYHPPKDGTVNVYVYDQTGISQVPSISKKLVDFYKKKI